MERKPYRPGDVILSDALLEMLEKGKLKPGVSQFDQKRGQVVTPQEQPKEIYIENKKRMKKPR